MEGWINATEFICDICSVVKFFIHILTSHRTAQLWLIFSFPEFSLKIFEISISVFVCMFVVCFSHTFMWMSFDFVVYCFDITPNSRISLHTCFMYQLDNKICFKLDSVETRHQSKACDLSEAWSYSIN
ncbi:CLUMA_CG011383, isoform A [Clunio marinus]|uniref:CLUMA_CG011383, isoform A n=1 Tax=Clunio marinus TaxID=568069 RepID=A0A1J1IG46_9DIPT|nr:CLUMA_CG011383, isoform A [Clunio marinus]